MRTILGLILVCLLAATAFAQDRNFPAALGTGLPPLNSSGPPPGLNYGGFPNFPAALGTGLPPLNSFGPPPGLNYGGSPGGDGYGYGFDGYGYAAPYPNAPRVIRVVLIQQPAVPAAPPAPPEPIHSSIQNVSYPNQNPSSAPPAFFIIVLNNGSRLTASAVWVQGKTDPSYMDGDGQVHRVPLADVDRTATRELNQAHHLNLRLPPPGRVR